MNRRIATLLSAFIFLTTTLQLSYAQCRTARPGDIAHGGNEIIKLPRHYMSRIQGRIFVPNGSPGRDVVVEVYPYDGFQDVSQMAMDRPRMDACVTGADGRFTFAKLRAGQYVLRAGSRNPYQFNEVRAVIVLRPGRPGDRPLKINMRPGS